MAVVTCACRDCFEITYAAPDMFTPTLCEECREAGCIPELAHEGADYNCPGCECQRDNAYDTREYSTETDTGERPEWAEDRNENAFRRAVVRRRWSDPSWGV